MNFFESLTTKNLKTENNMPVHSTSGSFLLDLFYKQGSCRINPQELIPLFIGALSENPTLTIRSLFYCRDIRFGQGERDIFRQLFRHLCQHYPQFALQVMHFIPVYGRFDDLLAGLYTPIEKEIADFLMASVKDNNVLCAKWMPREGKKYDNFAKRLMELTKTPPKIYRKMIARVSAMAEPPIVENLMCQQEWEAIDFNTIPSQAIKKYRKAWYRHLEEKFTSWLESLTKEDKPANVKINSKAIFPHDIVAQLMGNISISEMRLANAQWAALPNFVPEGESFIPVCDVSGSMGTYDGLPMKVCIALGIYLSERNTGPFKDGFITFSHTPTLQILKGNLSERVQMLKKAHWAMNTNLEKVFQLILEQAIKNKLDPKEMPKNIIILSDMQFDVCVQEPNDSAQNMIKRMYKEAGYKRPNVCFWNLRSSTGVPVKAHKEGYALVSGFSPSIMVNLFRGEMTPEKIMLNTLNSERYLPITL